MHAMQVNGINRISLKEADGFAIELEKTLDFDSHFIPPPQRDSVRENISPVPKPGDVQTSATHLGAEATHLDAIHTIESPMVGTFYTSASPSDPPFVQIGTRVNEESVVCIIEAMKVMNEVKAGRCGEIAEISVDNGQPVEFGTQLFKIKK